MRTPSLNSVFGIWRLINGVPYLILVPAIPKEFLPPEIDLMTDDELMRAIEEIDPSKIQNKVPGGGGEEGEDGIVAGTRETKEEIGLRKKRRYTPKLLMKEPDIRTNHVKEGYAMHRSAFRGKMRTKIKREEDSILLPPIEIPLDEAHRIIFQSRSNKFHRDFVRSLEKHIKNLVEKKGLRSTGPALAA